MVEIMYSIRLVPFHTLLSTILKKMHIETPVFLFHSFDKSSSRSKGHLSQNVWPTSSLTCTWSCTVYSEYFAFIDNNGHKHKPQSADVRTHMQRTAVRSRAQSYAGIRSRTQPCVGMPAHDVEKILVLAAYDCACLLTAAHACVRLSTAAYACARLCTTAHGCVWVHTTEYGWVGRTTPVVGYVWRFEVYHKEMGNLLCHPIVYHFYNNDQWLTIVECMFLLYQPIRNVAYKITPILCAILLYHPNTLHFITISPIFKFTRLPSSLCTEHFIPLPSHCSSWFLFQSGWLPLDLHIISPLPSPLTAVIISNNSCFFHNSPSSLPDLDLFQIQAHVTTVLHVMRCIQKKPNIYFTCCRCSGRRRNSTHTDDRYPGVQ